MDKYAWGKAFSEVFFPQRACLNCGELALGTPLCPVCLQKAEPLRRCPACASFIANTETEHYLCPFCRHERPSFDAAYAALPYQGHLRQILINFKYHQQTGYRRSLGALLIEALRKRYDSSAFDVIVPVPAHAARLNSRGYNQAELLSYIVAQETGINHQPGLLVREKETMPLTKLTRKQRIAELHGAFAATADLRGKDILLIDDIFTTGATAEMCSRALLTAHARSVSCLSVAAGYALP